MTGTTMARSYSASEAADLRIDPATGDWQVLRGDLVALLDKVESRYGRVDGAAAPASGLFERVRQLRSQVDQADPAARRAPPPVSGRRPPERGDNQNDGLSAAIAEIRDRQGPAQGGMMGRRATDMPEIRELGNLITGMSQRLERLEGDLTAQRANAESVQEVTEQVDQLTQVVELLAGAVGETGQVKRLESQIAALGAMIEDVPRLDLNTLTARLDDVSGTVAKLAELQAEQMEREIVREERRAAEAASKPEIILATEESVRAIYDRIEMIERSVSANSSDFERLTSEMANFTRVMEDFADTPEALLTEVRALVARIDSIEASTGEVAGLKTDIAALQEIVLQGLEPRLDRMDTKLDLINENGGGAVQGQLKSLMGRMDDASAQLDRLAQLYETNGQPNMDTLATMLAERATETLVRRGLKIDPMSLRDIEERIGEIIRTSNSLPDYETIAQMVTARTADGDALPAEGFVALEKRMMAMFNTAGKETAERLARLEATLTGRKLEAEAGAEAQQAKPAAAPAAATPAPAAKEPVKETAAAAQTRDSKLDSILASLSRGMPDAMPKNPADEAPLIDRGPQAEAPRRAAAAAAAPEQVRSRPVAPPQAQKPATEKPAAFDPTHAERPPRPRSSLALADTDPFAPVAPAPTVETPAPVPSSTSTFVAAARRAQRTLQEQPTKPASSSVIGRALSRVRKPGDEAAEGAANAAKPADPAKVDPKLDASKAETAKAETPKAEPAKDTALPAPEALAAAAGPSQPSFLVRHRRPLLLAATLAAVSILALNLVLQRTAPTVAPTAAVAVTSPTVDAAPQAPQAATPRAELPAETPVIESLPEAPALETAPEAEPAPEPQASLGNSIDDSVTTGSIPRTATPALETAMATPTLPALPDLLAARETGNPVVTGDMPDLVGSYGSETTGSIGRSTTEIVAGGAETFDMPPEAVGPEPMRLAAANGDVRAQFEVAAIYTEGRVIDQDMAEAAKWYERAAAKGFAPAQYRLGNLYEAGTGVEKDLEQARLWYQRAAESGNRMAMHNLAALYAGGQLGEQQFEQAAEWFEKAADRGMTDSQFNLGMLYARGLGVEQDFEQSYKYFALAARSGDRDAAQARDDIAKSLSMDAVNSINETLKGWSMAPVDLAANFAPIGSWSDSFDPGEVITNKEVVTRVQQALAKLGFDVGTADGVVGRKTRDAIRAFEKSTGMSEGGEVNPRLLAVLGSQPV